MFFRDFVRRHGERLGVVGMVQNLPDVWVDPYSNILRCFIVVPPSDDLT